MTVERLQEILDAAASRRILVAGDLMLDEFVSGNVSRISPEAPVPVVEVTAESHYPGGAANVARNLREFTKFASVMGMVGGDAPGRQLCGLLDAAGIDTTLVQRDESLRTTVKTRIVARHQQIVRVDRESQQRPSDEHIQHALARMRTSVGALDALIFADYGKGFLTQHFVEGVCAMAREAGTIVTVDPKPASAIEWHGVTAIKPNRAEAFAYAGANAAGIQEVGQALLGRWNPGSLLITMGDEGMTLFRGGREPYRIATRAQAVFDVSGAGDTAIALFTLSLAAGASPEEAAEISNYGSGIVVGKLGTATTNPRELMASLHV
jgi:D-glycero-beta-D-manno-heptose-7-phosphate kinase